ncbi:MAG TPA: glycosyltransferase, partial [Aldersonia sp.]
VRIEGFVEDLEPVFARATAALAPLRFGSGIKIKMLDALSRGVPVLATDVSVDGIPVAADGSDGCIVDNALVRWPAHIEALLDPAHNAAMSAGGRAFFSRLYGRSSVMADYDEMFGLEPVEEIARPA